jgi:AraC family transcriptional activator of pobA
MGDQGLDHGLRILRRIGHDVDDAVAEARLGQAGSRSAEILSRFRRLLEERYRQQLRVVDYAGLLGVTPDRLHGLCSRKLKRSPSALIQQRVIREAVTRLETSSATVKQIAFALGFKDTAYFSRFFSKHTSEAPGAWRKRVAAQAGTRISRPTLNFADWP